MVLTLNLISLVSRKALVPFEFDVHLRGALRKAVSGREESGEKNENVMKIHL